MSKLQHEYQRTLNRQRHEFLLTFFADQEKDEYAIRIVNGWKLIKQWNGGTNHWEVAIHPPENIQVNQSPCPETIDKGQTTILETDKMPF